ncbi:MAG TPA: HAMP domain-containing sensor histidine kinase [Burkholderiales bacterium]|nr:HAMP domain-containing sensor histidine kinase [Burkholderiales bacterium]
MLDTLHRKLAAVLLTFGVVAAGLCLVVMRMTHEAYHREASQSFHRSLAAQLAASAPLVADGRLDPAGAARLFDQTKLINPQVDLYLVDADGAITGSSVEKAALARNSIALRPIERFLSNPVAYPVMGDDPRNAARTEVFSAARLQQGELLAGYLYVVLRGDEAPAGASGLRPAYVLRETLLVIGGALAVSLLAALALTASITRPLRRLATAMDGFRASDFAVLNPLPETGRGRDEIERLTIAFLEMARRIQDQMRSLRATDTQRREMVANVSHDLRTPLAAVIGYLETLQVKSTTLSPDERAGYLEIALKQCRYLNTLVENLFELARLEADQVPFSPEALNLGDLVEDVVQKVSLRASEKRIALVTDYPDALPLVLADAGLVERVLENLIENALSYTPEKGRVSVRISPAPRSVWVSVEDTGCGIPPEDLPRVFDRFYRGEKSRHDASGHAGLGLAIARRIVELHGGEISVASLPDAGATFAFALPTANSAPAAAHP